MRGRPSAAYPPIPMRVRSSFHAPGSGDDEIVRQAKRYAVDGPVAVVTADRGLIDRVRAIGADVIGPGWLLDRLPEAPSPE